jgi:hypothetical protein
VYHLHVSPIPDDGNCTKALAHLDPFIRGEKPVCDPSFPQTCQVGDLSGKYGTIPVNQDPFEVTYVDLFASTQDGLGAFFGNRSLVVHLNNATRITCANFQSVANVTAPTSSSGCSPSPTTTPMTNNYSTTIGPTGPSTPSPSFVTAGSASVRMTGTALLMTFAAGVMFML